MEEAVSNAQNRVYLLVSSDGAPGGIARATATLANQLVETHYVEMISLRRRQEQPYYPLDPRVKVTCILDDATPAELLLKDAPSEVAGVQMQGNSALIDRLLPRVLTGLGPGIVISTRPLFHLAMAQHAPAHCITIAQEHNSLQFREAKDAVDLTAEAIGRLDQYVVLTEADAESYRRIYPEAAEKIRVIGNPAPWPISAPVEKRQKIVVAVGRLGGRKGFDRLIEAYRPIPKRFPNWQVHIYGEGPHHKRLDKQIEKAGLREFVFLKGRTDNMERVLEEASILTLTSKYEGLPMVLIEAMTKGVPVVSVDCPNGPAEIVVDGVTGRLVPSDDLTAFRAALTGMMEDSFWRGVMSKQALKHATRYQVERVTQNWLDMFQELRAKRVLVGSAAVT